MLSTTGDCDTIRTITVTELPLLTNTTNAKICANELPYVWNGNSYLISGEFIDTIKNLIGGCDTIAILNLTITTGAHTTVDITECNSYTWTGGDGNTYITSGLYDHITTAANGCTDTLMLNLTITTGTHTTVDVTECNSYTWTGGDGNTYTTSGLYDHITTAANGCTDTVTLNLTITTGTHTTVDVTECNSYTWTANNQVYTTSGLYDYITTPANGCTDTVTLNLTITNGTHTTVDVTECNSYTWTGGDGNTYTTSGLYDHITTAANGCTDTLTLNLTITTGTHTTVDVTECNSYTWTGGDGNTYTTSGLYDHITTAANGCTDTLTLNLTITTGTHTTVDVTECNSYTWTGGDGNTYTTSGLYDHITTAANGCTDTLTLNLTITTGTHTSVDVTECNSYTWTGGDGNTYTTSGLYDHITTAANGCTDTLTLNLTITTGTHTTVDVTECNSYTWTGGNGNTYTTSGLYDHITTPPMVVPIH